MDRLDLVGHQRLVDGRDDGNPAAHGRLEGDRPADAAGTIEQFAAVLGQHGLVGRDHVLSACSTLSMIERSGSRPPISCTTASISGSFRTVERSVVSSPGGGTIFRGGRFRRIDDPHQFDFPAGLAGNPLRLLKQQPCHARTDRAEPDNRHFRGRFCHRLDYRLRQAAILRRPGKASTRSGCTFNTRGLFSKLWDSA